MRVVHIPLTYYPDVCGGTEVYVHALAKRTGRYAFDSLIAAPGVRDASYLHDGIPVEPFALRASSTLRDVYGAGDPVAATKFDAILERWEPDVVHLHAFTMGASLLMVEAAKRRGLPVVFTYHTPTASC